jgi:hypothetical protein
MMLYLRCCAAGGAKEDRALGTRYNLNMTLHGTIQNGVVVLEGGTALPDGTPVEVIVARSPFGSAPPVPPPSESMTEEERQRLLAAIDRIASLPLEGSDEPFSGADHDKVLYGKP